MVKKPGLTIGICAYNEGRDIGKLLPILLAQKFGCATLDEILVVSSGSTDSTDSIVKKFSARDRRIRLIREKSRRGKVSAVNIILEQAKGGIILFCGADIRPDENAIGRLVGRLDDPKVGMAGARPIPGNDRNTFPGFCTHLLWDLHHRISLKSPKCGEMVAIRNRGYRIPAKIPVDEAYLEYLVKKDGFSLAYAQDAIVHNRGPASVADYLKQRRRIHAQHMRLRKATGYRVATNDLGTILSALPQTLFQSPRSFVFSIGAIALESISAVLGAFDTFIAQDDHAVWEIVQSTKEVPA